MKIKLPVIFSQFDPKWANNLLGFNTNPEFNFYNYACLICCLAAIARYYGKDIDPVALNQKLKDIAPVGDPNAAFRNGGEYVNGKFSQLFPDITERAVVTPGLLTDDQMTEIKAEIDSGRPVILGIDYNPKTLKFDSHFVIAVDYNPNDENDITIADSLGGREHSLKDYLSGQVDSARKSIWKYFILTGTKPSVVNPSPATPAPSPVEAAPDPSSGIPGNFPQLVHKATQWDLTVNKYMSGHNPDQTFFAREDLGEDLLRAIEKIKPQGEVRIEERIVEKIVEKEVPAPAIHTSEGHASEQWNQLVAYLALEKAPADTSFEDIKRVIAGIKSRATDFENQAKEAAEENAALKTSIQNLSDELSNRDKDLTQIKKLHKAQLDSLKKSQPNFDGLIKQYESIIAETKGEYTQAFDELKALRVEVAVKDVDVVSDTNSGGFSFHPLEFIKRYLVIKW